MAIINKPIIQNVELDSVLKYNAELKKTIGYTNNPASAAQRKVHLVKRENRLEKELTKVKALQSMIPGLEKNIHTLKKGIQKLNTKIQDLESIGKLQAEASKTRNLLYKFILHITISLKEACLGYSTNDLPRLKVLNQKIKNTLSQLKKIDGAGLSERIGHLNHLKRVARSEKTQIDRLAIPIERALQSAEHQIKIDIARKYTYTINDQNCTDVETVTSKLNEISDAGIGRLVLYKLSTQTLPLLLKEAVQDQMNAFYHQTPDNAQYIVHDISDSKNIRITEKNGIIHINLTVKHSVKNLDQEEYYQMDSSIDLELDKAGNIVRTTLNVEPTS